MRFARITIIVMIVILFTIGILHAQIRLAIEPKPDAQDRELDIPMYQKDTTFPTYPGDPDQSLSDTLFIFKAAGGDSSAVFYSWDFVGITYEVFVDTVGDTPQPIQFNLIVYIGKAFNDTTRMFVPFDTLSVDTSGVGNWDHNVPVSTHFMYAVEGATGTDSTGRIYATVHRRRYEEEVPEVDIFPEADIFSESHYGFEYGFAKLIEICDQPLCVVNHYPYNLTKAWRKRLWHGKDGLTLTIKQ